jgi:hypothetical protein
MSSNPILIEIICLILALAALGGAIALIILAFALRQAAYRIASGAEPLRSKPWTKAVVPILHGLAKALDTEVPKRTSHSEPKRGKQDAQQELFQF